MGVDLLSQCCNRRGHNHNHSKQPFVKLVKVTTRNFQVFVDSGGFFDKSGPARSLRAPV